jgi:hypothetical protein
MTSTVKATWVKALRLDYGMGGLSMSATLD